MVKVGSTVCLRTKDAIYETCVVHKMDAKTISVQYRVYGKDKRLATKTEAILRRDIISMSERTI